VKRNAVIRILACALVLLAVPAALLAFAFGLPAQYGETFLGELKYKYETLAQTPGKRIVVVGGSGVAFGQDSALLESRLPGYSVVNFGMYAGLGSTVMLDLARPLLRAGDIVIFSPEQSGQTLSTYLNAEAMWQAADGAPALLGAVRREDWGTMAGQFPHFAARKARFFRDGSAPAGEGVYARSAFNARGDIEYPDRGQNVMAGGYDPNMPICFDTALPSEEFLDYVNDYAAACEELGAAFYYRFCPMNALAVAPEELARLDDYRAYLEDRLDCEILGSPHSAIMDGEWFYDTNFHLNSAGAVVNTALLAAELKAVLGDGSPVDIPLPDKPEFAGAVLTEGDNSDGECFTFEQVGDALRLTGLTAAGAERERLVVPVSYDGLPVTGFAAEVFAGNTALREIVVQGSIRGIEDGSFDGCTALERLVVAISAPERCPVGQGLLTGTQADIYVPAERLSAYLTNYFWSVHAPRIRGQEGLTAEDGPVSTPVPTPTATQPPDRTGRDIRYEGNGGVLKRGEGDSVTLPMDSAHLRVNTAQGTRHFAREGYVLTGWNTAADGSGRHIGLGSRVERQEGLVLYAQWAQASPAGEFDWRQEGETACITGYRGSSGVCVVPETIGGLPVGRICAGAFRDAALDTLVLPSGLVTVEEGAFTGCAIGELFLFDSLKEIRDESFADCTGPAVLHINAAVSPVYSGTYFDTFSDKYDWLLSIREEKKLVLFSGSSGRYGYDSPKLRAAFPEYQVANMGVYAYTNALPQLDLIRKLMGEGDVLLSAPEFDTAHNQFCSTDRLDAQFWAMMESNYDAAAELDMGAYSHVFGSLGEYLTARGGMGGRNYGMSPSGYDDDGNYYAFPTYNQYGDFILPRPNGERDELLTHNIADYTVDNIPPAYVDSLNAVYQRFLDQGIAVYFTYTPRNWSSLTEESTPQAWRALHEYLSENLCVPVISDIEDYLFSGVYFYLIDSHLSDQGVAMRTERIIADLAPWLRES